MLYAAVEQLQGQVGAVDGVIIELRILQGQRAAQVAVTLGVSEKSVRVRHCRLLSKLRRLLNIRKPKGLCYHNRGGQTTSKPPRTRTAGKSRKKV